MVLSLRRLISGNPSRLSRQQRHAGELRLSVHGHWHMRSSRAGRVVRGVAGDKEEVDNSDDDADSNTEDDAKPHNDDAGHDLVRAAAIVAMIVSFVGLTWIAPKIRHDAAFKKCNEEETIQVLSESFSAVKQALSSGTLAPADSEALHNPQEDDCAPEQDPRFIDKSSERMPKEASRWDAWENLLQTEGTKKLPLELHGIFRCDVHGNVVMWRAEMGSPLYFEISRKIRNTPEDGPSSNTADGISKRQDYAVYYGVCLVKKNMAEADLSEEQPWNMACGIEREQLFKFLRGIEAACHGMPEDLRREIYDSMFSRLSTFKNDQGAKGWDTRLFDWDMEFENIINGSALIEKHRSELKELQAPNVEPPSLDRASKRQGSTNDEVYVTVQDSLDPQKKAGSSALKAECKLETLGLFTISVLVNIQKRQYWAAKALGALQGKGPGEADSSNLTNLASYVRETAANLCAATEPSNCHLWQLVRNGELIGIYVYSSSPANYGLLIAEHERGSQQIRGIMTDSKAASGVWRERLHDSLEWIRVDDVPAELAEELIIVR